MDKRRAKLYLPSMDNAQGCKEKEVRLSSYTRPVIGLMSFPGSGNTWTRHLIQQMSGLATSSCYCDDMLRSNGFPFECHHELFKTIVVKTHEFKHAQEYNFEKIILLIRNPYDAILSYANYLKRRHTGTASTFELKQVVRGIFNHSIKWYGDLVDQTIHHFNGPVLVLQFDSMKTEMVRTLWKIAKFININVTQKDIDCTMRLQEGNFHRNMTDKQHFYILKEVYTKEMLMQMRDTVNKANVILREAYNMDIDIGGETEQRLLTNTSILQS
ncbi:hypothetical protein ACF0H5_002112 [Mactra antiquata]